MKTIIIFNYFLLTQYEILIILNPIKLIILKGIVDEINEN